MAGPGAGARGLVAIHGNGSRAMDGPIPAVARASRSVEGHPRQCPPRQSVSTPGRAPRRRERLASPAAETCEVGGPSFVVQRVPEGQPHRVDMRIAALDLERLVACTRVHRPGRQRCGRIHAAGGPGGAEWAGTRPVCPVRPVNAKDRRRCRKAGSRIVARIPNRKRLRRSWHLDETCFRLVPDIRGTGMKLAGR